MCRGERVLPVASAVDSIEQLNDKVECEIFGAHRPVDVLIDWQRLAFDAVLLGLSVGGEAKLLGIVVDHGADNVHLGRIERFHRSVSVSRQVDEVLARKDVHVALFRVFDQVTVQAQRICVCGVERVARVVVAEMKLKGLDRSAIVRYEMDELAIERLEHVVARHLVAKVEANARRVGACARGHLGAVEHCHIMVTHVAHE